MEYSFTSKAEEMDIESKELREYGEYFEEKILPEMKEVEQRRIKAEENAYQLHVSLTLSKKSCYPFE